MTIRLLHQRFIRNSWTLALAESCTGGGLASSFVAIPDCSLYFRGGVVAYSNEIKEQILGVKPTTLVQSGEVSEQTALEMAFGILNLFKVNIALSTTGIAGPSGEETNKPVGTVCFAIVSEGDPPLLWTAYFEGSRRLIIQQAIQDALKKLDDYTRPLNK
ncbi:MAG: CinA family protein [Chlamydiales bacterium]